MERHKLHRWLFKGKSGKEIRFSAPHMPFSVFMPNAVWGGSCTIGEAICCIRIRHNSSGEKGRRLEVWFPHKEYREEVPYAEATLVGYVKIRGNWKEKTAHCYFQHIEE